MAFIIDQLGLSNPFGTPIGQLIEKATDAEQATENWSLLLEICDIINETEEGPKDAMRAIRKRLQQAAGKSTQMTMFTLTVVETGVKNCGHRFHILVATKDFMQDLVKLIGPKNDPPQVLQERVLSLIQTWADAFATSPDLREVARVYQELRTKGIEFPMTDLDNLAPIYTPARSFPDPEPVQHHAPAARPTPAQPPSQAPSVHHSHQHVARVQPQQQHVHHKHCPLPADDTRLGSLSAEQTAKLRRDLDIVYQNCFVFNDMLTELKPGHESTDELVLLQELNLTCHQMQARIMELVQQVQNEDITGELLRVNDDLLNAFVRYERFERQRRSQGGGATPDDDEQLSGPPPSYEHSATLPLHQRHVAPPAPAPAVGNLIDFDAPTSNDHFNTTNVNSGMAGLSLADARASGLPQGGSGFNDDFDMFAQSRQSFEQNQKQLSSGAAYRNQQEDRYTGGLGAAINAKVTPGSDQAKKSSDRASSSEFDEFLSERTRGLGDGSRSYLVDNMASSQQQAAARPPSDSDHDNPLFAL